MKNVILFDSNEQYNQQQVQKITDSFKCEIIFTPFKDVLKLQKIILAHDRTALIGTQLWNVASKLMKFKKIIVVNIFCDADAIESPTINATNVASMDLSELSNERLINLLNLWFNVPEYKPDGIHDEYVLKLKEWGR